ncbi:KTSC domain-containing protein [Listeria monocytogenes]|nr:KTSC domain-containing protein [Listeria monocytogenes]
MQRSSVSSSRIRSVGWENDILEIEFKDGSIYHYNNVSQSEYSSFMQSGSLGTALSHLDKVHTYNRVN